MWKCSSNANSEIVWSHCKCFLFGIQFFAVDNQAVVTEKFKHSDSLTLLPHTPILWLHLKNLFILSNQPVKCKIFCISTIYIYFQVATILFPLWQVPRSLANYNMIRLRVARIFQVWWMHSQPPSIIILNALANTLQIFSFS